MLPGASGVDHVKSGAPQSWTRSQPLTAEAHGQAAGAMLISPAWRWIADPRGNTAVLGMLQHRPVPPLLPRKRKRATVRISNS